MKSMTCWAPQAPPSWGLPWVVLAATRTSSIPLPTPSTTRWRPFSRASNTANERCHCRPNGHKRSPASKGGSKTCKSDSKSSFRGRHRHPRRPRQTGDRRWSLGRMRIGSPSLTRGVCVLPFLRRRAANRASTNSKSGQAITTWPWPQQEPKPRPQGVWLGMRSISWSI